MNTIQINRRQYFAPVCAVFLCAFSFHTAASDIVVGWIEKVMLLENNLYIHSKLDTGADSSSLNAIDPVITEEGKDKYITFTITNREGDQARIHKRIIRWAVVKTKVGVTSERPVVIMPLCLGNTSRHVEVNLVNRSNFAYQMLIGRNFLAGNPNLLINSATEYTTEPSCRLDDKRAKN